MAQRPGNGDRVHGSPDARIARRFKDTTGSMTIGGAGDVMTRRMITAGNTMREGLITEDEKSTGIEGRIPKDPKYC